MEGLESWDGRHGDGRHGDGRHGVGRHGDGRDIRTNAVRRGNKEAKGKGGVFSAVEVPFETARPHPPARAPELRLTLPRQRTLEHTRTQRGEWAPEAMAGGHGRRGREKIPGRAAEGNEATGAAKRLGLHHVPPRDQDKGRPPGCQQHQSHL
jgi:hypothetical protein